MFLIADDEAAAAHINSHNTLQSYAYNLRNSLANEKLAGKFDPADNEKLEDVFNETISWLDSSWSFILPLSAASCALSSSPLSDCPRRQSLPRWSSISLIQRVRCRQHSLRSPSLPSCLEPQPSEPLRSRLVVSHIYSIYVHKTFSIVSA
ncbi:hypothetical protein C8Q73DRAFT_426410 [Cubamyces lactineus]|nr:hypothetical protein C8Q73DRAFT_426410 [Cubamyces lactineus]